jgi:hypothetical protein
MCFYFEYAIYVLAKLHVSVALKGTLLRILNSMHFQLLPLFPFKMSNSLWEKGELNDTRRKKRSPGARAWVHCGTENLSPISRGTHKINTLKGGYNRQLVGRYYMTATQDCLPYRVDEIRSKLTASLSIQGATQTVLHPLLGTCFVAIISFRTVLLKVWFKAS